MQKFLIACGVATFVAALAVSPFFSTSAMSHPQVISGAYTHASPSAAGLTIVHGVVRLAQSHADICLDNETQCLQGCDGAQSCSNQCEANYQGCMSQGG